MKRSILKIQPSGYAAMLPTLSRVARAHGYALAVHGSMKRDLDLIAAPWIDDASDSLTLANALRRSVGAVWHHEECDHLVKQGNATIKPHGRLAYSLHLTNRGADGPYIDLSVMPRASK